jgi:hypothetical protein
MKIPVVTVCMYHVDNGVSNGRDGGGNESVCGERTQERGRVRSEERKSFLALDLRVKGLGDSRSVSNLLMKGEEDTRICACRHHCEYTSPHMLGTRLAFIANTIRLMMLLCLLCVNE